MRTFTTLLAASLLVGCHSPPADVALSRGVTPEKMKESKMAEAKAKADVPLAGNELPASAMFDVRSDAFTNGGAIPSTYSAYGEKSSPPLTWGKLPAGTRSVMLIVDDPEAAAPKPFIHWVLYNLSPEITELRTAIPATGQVRQLKNVKQGMNSSGSIGYFGPKPPMGDPPHHYHFQVFALDAMLPLEQGAKKAEVIAAAKGHVLARGELVGTFQKP